MKYTELDRNGIQEKYPFQNLPDNWEGVDMPDNNGSINLPLLLRTLYRLCRKHGVELFEYATVKCIEADPSKTANWVVKGELRSKDGASSLARDFAYKGNKIAITSGAYVNHVLYPSFGFTLNVSIWEMVSYNHVCMLISGSLARLQVSQYYAIDPSVHFDKMWFHFAGPTEQGESNLFYGFPSLPWGPPNLCRIAVDAATNIINDPDERQYSVISPADLKNTSEWIRKHVLGVGPHPLPDKRTSQTICSC